MWRLARRWLAHLLGCLGGCLLVAATTIEPMDEDDDDGPR